MSFIEKHFWYLRGVGNIEAQSSLKGKNGRVSNEIAMTNRGTENERLGFGLNKNKTGIDFDIFENIFTDLNYYSVLGAHAEKNKNPRDFLDSSLSGFILIFAVPENLDINKTNLFYGKKIWQTTSKLPDNIDEYLVGIMDGCKINNFSESGILPRNDGFNFYPGKKFKDKLSIYNFEQKSFKLAFIELLKYLDRKL